jgi:anti-sigma factor RsiW
VSSPGELSCREIVELVTDYLEDALPPEARLRVELHLATCPGCLAYLDQMRGTVRLLGTLSEASLEPAIREKLVHAFRDWTGRSAR